VNREKGIEEDNQSSSRWSSQEVVERDRPKSEYNGQENKPERRLKSIDKSINQFNDVLGRIRNIKDRNKESNLIR
jgi:hypothetical protein